jgi:hypothetical protein
VTRFPAVSAGAFNRVEQPGHTTGIDMEGNPGCGRLIRDMAGVPGRVAPSYPECRDLIVVRNSRSRRLVSELQIAKVLHKTSSFEHQPSQKLPFAKL